MKQSIVILSLTAALLAGCQQQDLPGAKPAGGSVPLSIESALLTGQVVSRASGDVISVTSGNMGVFMDNPVDGAPGAGYTPQANAKYTYATPLWTSDNPIRLGGENAEVCAYYPYQISYTDSKAVPLQSRAYDPDHDLSYAKNILMNGTAGIADGKGSVGCQVAFAMERAYAMLAFEFIRKDYPGTCSITQIEVWKAPYQGSIDITTGTHGATSNTEDMNFKYATSILVPQLPDSYLTGSDATHATENCLIVPGNTRMGTTLPDVTPGGFDIVLTVDGATMTVNIPQTNLPTFEAGKIYRIKLLLNGSKSEVSDVTIAEWTPGPVDDTEYVPAP